MIDIGVASPSAGGGAQIIQAVNANAAEGYFLIEAVGTKSARGLGRQFEERPNGVAGLFPRAQFQYLAQQNENGDHRRGFVIDRNQTAVPLKWAWQG